MNTVTKMSTLVILMTILFNILVTWSLEQSEPWKQPLYSNRPYLATICVHFAIVSSMFLFTGAYSFMEYVPISWQLGGSILLICMASNSAAYLYSRLLYSFRFDKAEHESLLRQKQA